MKSRRTTAVNKPHTGTVGGTVEQWLSVAQIAQHLNVKPDTVYKWLERKDMPAHKVGRLWRFKISEIDRWIEKGSAGNVKDKL
jgi:excisionase family DNA binding protein